MKERKSKPRYKVAKEYLLEKIRNMIPGDNQLEPENLLTGKLSMSRETIRKAMSELIHEGVVTRWHGKGNFGHPRVTNLPMRMDINSDFRRILTEAGFSVRTIRSEAVTTSPSADMLKRMGNEATSEVITFEQFFYADEQLAIQCRVELPGRNVVTTPAAGEYTENINAFLLQYCNMESSHTTAWLRAGLQKNAAKRFGLTTGTPLLEWDEVYYNIHDQAIGYVKIYFHPEIIDLSLLLKF